MRKAEKVKEGYSMDSFNRLVIRRRQHRLIADGELSLARDNRLYYWLNETVAWRRQYNLSEKIAFDGNWRLNANYDLELNLRKALNRQANDVLGLKGQIISVDGDTLTFGINSRDKRGLSHARILKLSGCWKADDYNRLVFEAQKEGVPDRLVLKGLWQLNPDQQVSYTYEKIDLRTKKKRLQTLVFDGSWQIDNASRITYILKHCLGSVFDFRAQLESPNVYPEQGRIKYRVGIGIRGERPYQERTVSLYGTWKFGRNLGLVFQMDYGSGKMQELEFGAVAHLTGRDEITFSLLNKRQESLGINIAFNHRFLKANDAEAFLKLKRLGKELGGQAGVRIPF